MKKSTNFIFLILAILVCTAQVNRSKKDSNQVHAPLNSASELKISLLSKNDSTRRADIDQLKQVISRLEASQLVAKDSKPEHSDLIIALLTLLGGSLFTIVWTQYINSRTEKKGISRWKAELSVLSVGIINQIRYNDELINQLEANEIENIFPLYDISLKAKEFASLDKGVLFHFLEKRDRANAAMKNMAIHSLTGLLSDIFDKLERLQEKYRDQSDSEFSKLAEIAQSLHREIISLATVIKNDPQSSKDDETIIQLIFEIFRTKLSTLPKGTEHFQLVKTLFNPIQVEAHKFEERYPINKLLEVCASGSKTVATINSVRGYYLENLKIVNEELIQHGESIPVILSYLK